MKILSNITGSNSNANWTLQSQQVTILDAQNPLWPRAVILSSNGVRISRGNNSVGFPTEELILAAISLEPNLTWPPIVGTDPVNISANAPNATSFNIAATAEVTITYQWQKSTDNGGNWSNVANGGVYSNATTNAINISNVTGLNSNQFRCVAIDVSGSTNSNNATLTVIDPTITNTSAVTASNTINMSVIAQGGSALTYQWQNSGDNGGNWGSVINGGIFANATTNHLNISNFVTEHNNYYRCFVSDSAGNAISNTIVIPP